MEYFKGYHVKPTCSLLCNTNKNMSVQDSIIAPFQNQVLMSPIKQNTSKWWLDMK